MAAPKIQGTVIYRMKRIGVFGGSFDPIHFGHLYLALTLYEKHELDEVLFVPATHNPLKEPDLTSSYHRLEMLKLALEPLPQFKIDTIELDRSGPSFTIDTLRALHVREKGKSELFLLLGADALHYLHLWKDYDELFSLATPLVLCRNHKAFPELPELSEEVKKILHKGWTEAPLLEISATNIRKRLKDSHFCGHLMPAKVLDYIQLHQLY